MVMDALEDNQNPNSSIEVTDAIFQGLSETAVSTMLAQNFHWNVTGMAFAPLHQLFQDIYEDHFDAQDSLAERTRALGSFVDGSLASMISKSKIEECSERLTDKEMIKEMLFAQETLASTFAGVSDIAIKNGDKITEDLCVERGLIHEKFSWFLRAHME
jgi:starvation-inducible DNA-binding protein